MLKQNKSTKYLFYAIGEIFLVVIGILIALQINNWNEESKTKKSASAQLQILADNINDDLRQLHLLNAAIDTTLLSGTTLLKQFQGIIPFDNHTTKHIVQMLFEQNLYSNKTAFDKLANSGELSVLSPDLQQAISQYYILIERIREREEISNHFIKNASEPHYFDHYSQYNRAGNQHPALKTYYSDDQRSPAKLDVVAIDSDSKLEALTFGRLYQSKAQKEFYEKAITQADTVLNLIHESQTKTRN